jgi:hypothetical protein
MTRIANGTTVDEKPGMLTKLGSQTYRLGKDGRRLTFWSLAPRFLYMPAVSSVPGMPRHFVWLWDQEAREFVHAVVSPAYDAVLAVSEKWKAR